MEISAVFQALAYLAVIVLVGHAIGWILIGVGEVLDKVIRFLYTKMVREGTK